MIKCRCGAPCEKIVLERGGDHGWGDDASRTVLRYVAVPVDAIRATKHLAALEDFGRRHGKEDAEGLLEFYARSHYRVGMDDGKRSLNLTKFRDAIMHAYGITKESDFVDSLGELLDLIDAQKEIK